VDKGATGNPHHKERLGPRDQRELLCHMRGEEKRHRDAADYRAHQQGRIAVLSVKILQLREPVARGSR
tara:strand:- start:898 stop:1101 length:204 start_codon:yes stop_codon:yes gene_type:complete